MRFTFFMLKIILLIIIAVSIAVRAITSLPRYKKETEARSFLSNSYILFVLQSLIPITLLLYNRFTYASLQYFIST